MADERNYAAISAPKEGKKDAPPVEDKDIKQIVTAEAVVKTPGLGRKIKSIFFGGEFKSATKYVITDVFLPGIRDMMYDSVVGSAEQVFYGETRGRRSRRGSRTPAGIINYNKMSQRSMTSAILPDQPPRGMHRVNRRDSIDVLIVDREEAVLVLDTLQENIARYGLVSMSDLNSMIGRPSAVIDQKWGWSNLADARIRQTRDGSLLELPPLEEI